MKYKKKPEEITKADFVPLRLEPKRKKVVKAWIYKDHLTKRGRELSDNSMKSFYGSSWGGIGKTEIVFKKPANPMFIPVTITYTHQSPKKGVKKLKQ
jgi:hypothetical protein